LTRSDNQFSLGQLNYKNSGNSAWRAFISFYITRVDADGSTKIWFRR